MRRLVTVLPGVLKDRLLAITYQRAAVAFEKASPLGITKRPGHIPSEAAKSTSCLLGIDVVCGNHTKRELSSAASEFPESISRVTKDDTASLPTSAHSSTTQNDYIHPPRFSPTSIPIRRRPFEPETATLEVLGRYVWSLSSSTALLPRAYSLSPKNPPNPIPFFRTNSIPPHHIFAAQHPRKPLSERILCRLDRLNFFHQGPYTSAPHGPYRVEPDRVQNAQELETAREELKRQQIEPLHAEYYRCITPSGPLDFTLWPQPVQVPWRYWLGREDIDEAFNRIRMADKDYEAFLQGRSDEGGVSAASGGEKKSGGFTSERVDAGVPSALEGVEEIYVSETDEAFRVVSLRFKGSGKVGLDTFKKVTSLDDVTEISTKDFDPRGEYNVVLDKVRTAGNGQVSIFQVKLGGARSEYWIVSFEEEEERMVGLKAGSVES